MGPNYLDSAWEVLADPNKASINSITLFVALLCACILIGQISEDLGWMNGSITSLIIGFSTGIIILLTTNWRSSHILLFNEKLFFIYLLPPIIFNAGFQMKKQQFFRNFITISLFGAVGTLISFAIISLGAVQLFKKFDIDLLDLVDYLALGAILSATDSVCTLQVLNQDETPLLYNLVFGEGVVNNATSIVLFHAIHRFDLSHITSSTVMKLTGNFLYLFILSTLLGVVVGLTIAYIRMKLYFDRGITTYREVAIMILMAYLSYIMAELFHLSGILTVFFCGIVMSRYNWLCVNEDSRVTAKHTFATLSFMSEIFIFLYVGMDTLDIEKWKLASQRPGTLIALSATLLALVLVGRAATVFPLSVLSNLTKQSNSDKIGYKQQITIWWAGLMRGAVSVALAYNQFTRLGHTNVPKNAIMITSTISIVLFSTVVFGLLTKPLVRLLVLPREELSSMTRSSDELQIYKSLTSPLLEKRPDPYPEPESGMGDNNSYSDPPTGRMLLTNLGYVVHYYWTKFDNAVMRPTLGGPGYTPTHPILH